MKPYRLGLVGLGSVGAAVVRIFQQHNEMINQKAQRPVQLVAISARDKSRDRGVDLSRYQWVNAPNDIANSDDLDAVIELIGGAEGAAPDLIERALERRKNVVTANKALLASKGVRLATTAEKKNCALSCEAAIAGGLPVVKVIREALSANKITHLKGILNGTCNAILSMMEQEEIEFSVALKRAQEAGFAEADPTMDIDGYDAQQKIGLLSMMAFGSTFDCASISCSGIRAITLEDVKQAKSEGKVLRLIAEAKLLGEGEAKISVSVQKLEAKSTFGMVQGAMNVLQIESDAAGVQTYTGLGAGGAATASAVVADIIDQAAGRIAPVFAKPAAQLKPIKIV